MKFLKQVFLIITLFIAGSMYAQQDEVCYNPNLIKDTTKKSIKSMAVGIIGGDSVTISYHSPGVRKRIIWGGLVPFDEVWVTGAHDATMLEINKPFKVSGKTIPAGKYALFSIPGQDEWTLIINKHWQQHLASEYDEGDDIVRIKVKPFKVPHTERLQYFIEEGKNGEGKIAVAWEQVRVEMPFKLTK
jgi:hypothetical protein